MSTDFDPLFDSLAFPSFDDFSSLDAPGASMSALDNGDVDAAFQDLMLQLGATSPAEAANSPASSVDSSIAPETPPIQLAALPDVVIVDDDEPSLAAEPETIKTTAAQTLAEPPLSPSRIPPAAQYDPRLAAMLNKQQDLLQGQRVKYAEAQMELGRISLHYAQFGVHIPMVTPMLMQLASSVQNVQPQVQHMSVPVPRTASPSRPKSVSSRKSKARPGVSAEEQTAPSSGPTRTAGKDVRAEPYGRPLPPSDPHDLEASLAAGEYFRQIRLAKERRAKQDGAQAVVPSVLLPPF